MRQLVVLLLQPATPDAEVAKSSGVHMMDFSFEVDDLELDDLTVTTMRDGVALPESGASSNSCSCSSSSCCCCNPQYPTQ
jgi:thiazolylpeptide-type bacteriocin precursor